MPVPWAREPGPEWGAFHVFCLSFIDVFMYIADFQVFPSFPNPFLANRDPKISTSDGSLSDV